jgi:hypothetical protein
MICSTPELGWLDMFCNPPELGKLDKLCTLGVENSGRVWAGTKYKGKGRNIKHEEGSEEKYKAQEKSHHRRQER